MITAYVVAIPSYYEGEDIEISYCIYDNQNLMCKKSILKEYKKPAIVNLIALREVLKELEQYMDRKIVIVMNDTALNEQISGTSTSKNKDVLKMASIVREKIKKFTNPIIIKDVSNNREELVKWNDILK
ncbi:hypothetical protein SAMN00017405_0365 [Desulfonispora thiosulfatigenes DSM 11270]|uniref:RNase H n=1 Tax=Desulfonispora thiosulfatigenes DSM 11270 TaxID=656914 RepID=A0A1W1VPI3_DESTI|nr:hypothetical protein [Desulfonispora thiosulfatigenes]SMB95282.1 hypothetical protein SAMN00017405_0365 [Desulfonispora thiosulfatigenes DSM 11270]